MTNGNYKLIISLNTQVRNLEDRLIELEHSNDKDEHTQEAKESVTCCEKCNKDFQWSPFQLITPTIINDTIYHYFCSKECLVLFLATGIIW